MRNNTWLSAIIFLAFVALVLAPPAGAQDENKSNADKKFKGVITAIDEDSIKVERKKNDGGTTVRSFVITKNTRFVIDGKAVKRTSFEKGMHVLVKFFIKDSERVAKKVTNRDED